MPVKFIIRRITKNVRGSQLKIMAKKTNNRTAYKEVGNHTRNHETLPDEITLRDEILELKRQIMVLKRTNEHYTVKLRKYEDEAKRKDKQVEQLLDPRKNADVTKVLSTKGAAILMNLKDQNNALIQMILNRDLQIRRLVSEIKMSKLYASTRKNEGYRAEINRLRNLLIKSKETLKENIDVQQPERSICASGNSLLEFSSSSDQSSPRDLDELRATILSLESHIQHSNDLLAKKNQEISILTSEVNFLRKCFRYKTYRNKTFEYDKTESKNHAFSTADLTSKWSESFASTKISTQDVHDLFETIQEENPPYSAPAASIKRFSSIDPPSKCRFQLHVTGERNENRTEEKTVFLKINNDNFEQVSVLEKSLFHSITANELKKEKSLSNCRKTISAKEKWMEALNRLRELKKLKPPVYTVYDEIEKGYKTELSDGECEKTEVVQRKPRNLEDLDTQESYYKESGENIFSVTPTSDVESGRETPKACQNSDTSVLNRNEVSLDSESVSSDEMQKVKSEAQSTEVTCSQECQDEDLEKHHDKCDPLQTETNKIKSPREIYHQSFDSSFDSESSYLMKQEVRQMEVEVQINSFSQQNDSDQSEHSVSENNLIFEIIREDGGNCAPDAVFNDDDDVIIREK